ncbi:MAG: hypothetical protein AAGG07_03495 [Planctomycetota bacterium]
MGEYGDGNGGVVSRSDGAPPGGVCPYCGGPIGAEKKCPACGGLLDPLSRQASQNRMGPWFIRDERRPFLPGCNYDTLAAMARSGRLKPTDVLRGPTTGQFWRRADRVPSVAHLLGRCHACGASAQASEVGCRACGASFSPDTDRQHLGLAPVRLLPGEADPARIAASEIPPTSR